MKNKITLSEQLIITSKTPDHLPIDYNVLRNNVIKNYSYGENIFDHEYLPLKNYYNLTHDKNLQWLVDYIVHHSMGLHKIKLRTFRLAGLLLLPNESVDYHSNVDENDPNNSPDFSCLVAVSAQDSPIEVKFKYDKGRHKNLFGKKILKEKELLLINSEIPFAISTNKNQKPNILLSLQFQKL